MTIPLILLIAIRWGPDPVHPGADACCQTAEELFNKLDKGLHNYTDNETKQEDQIRVKHRTSPTRRNWLQCHADVSDYCATYHGTYSYGGNMYSPSNMNSTKRNHFSYTSKPQTTDGRVVIDCEYKCCVLKWLDACIISLNKIFLYHWKR